MNKKSFPKIQEETSREPFVNDQTDATLEARCLCNSRDRLRVEYHKIKICSRDIYPESYITKNTGIRRKDIRGVLALYGAWQDPPLLLAKDRMDVPCLVHAPIPKDYSCTSRALSWKCCIWKDAAWRLAARNALSYSVLYRGTSLIRNRPPPRTTMEP